MVRQRPGLKYFATHLMLAAAIEQEETKMAAAMTVASSRAAQIETHLMLAAAIEQEEAKMAAAMTLTPSRAAQIEQEEAKMIEGAAMGTTKKLMHSLPDDQHDLACSLPTSCAAMPARQQVISSTSYFNHANIAGQLGNNDSAVKPPRRRNSRPPIPSPPLGPPGVKIKAPALPSGPRPKNGIAMFRKGSLSPTSQSSHFSHLVNKYQTLDSSEQLIANHAGVSSSNASAMALDLGSDVVVAAQTKISDLRSVSGKLHDRVVMKKEGGNLQIGSKAAPSFLPAISGMSGPGTTYAQWNMGKVNSVSPSRNGWRQRPDIY